MLRRLRILPLTVTLAAVGIFGAGCGTDHAQVRVVHASPDAPAVDVAADGKTVVTNLAFAGLSPASGYLTVTAGTRRVEVRQAGTTTDLINSNVSFGTQKDYTVVVSGLVADSTIALVQKTDDNSAPQSGSVKLRVIHVSPSGSAHLDIYIVAPGTDITNMSPTISALAYQQASDYMSGAPTSNEVIMTATGDGTKTRLIDQTYNSLAAGQIRTLLVLDQAGGGAISPTPLVLADLN